LFVFIRRSAEFYYYKAGGDTKPTEEILMRKLTPLYFAAALGLSGIAQAQAAPVVILAAPALSSPILTIAACGPGTHLGPHGHYCWPNGHIYASLCPPGYVLGPHHVYCWPVGVSVPANYSGVCPPAYHLGPEGIRCWPG
jgi:hypothetical protein